jgi:hypothetical protein
MQLRQLGAPGFTPPPAVSVPRANCWLTVSSDIPGCVAEGLQSNPRDLFPVYTRCRATIPWSDRGGAHLSRVLHVPGCHKKDGSRPPTDPWERSILLEVGDAEQGLHLC